MDFQYVSRSVRGPGCSEEWEETLEGCECTGPCTAEAACSCLLGAEDNYTPDGILLDKKSGAPVLECHSECACSESCQNRLLQKGIQKKLKPFRCPSGKGFGIRAEETIPRGAFVCEYAGEIIGAEEVERRAAEQPKEHNYIFTLKEESAGQISCTFVDPRLKGSLARFVNHSCEPNLQPNAIRVGCPVPRVGFFAKREIHVGEELSYDYGPSAIQGEKPCLCGAPTCRGFLPMSATPTQ